jgi:hypothetical protein
MKEEYDQIRHIILQLFYYQQSLLKDGKLSAHERLGDIVKPISSENQIIYAMADDLKADFRKLDSILFLPPMEQDPQIIPALILDCDLSRQTDISIKIILYRFIGDSALPECIGFRFDGPEGVKDKKSRHNYWHFQLVKKANFHKGRKTLKCRDWLPTKMPCIPILANGPASLFICLLYSIYGKKMFQYVYPVEINQKFLRSLENILE